MKKLFVSIGILILAFSSIYAQDADPVLFKVEGVPVHLSEFNYIYSKNNGQKVDYSAESLKEYLDLYVKFKLKVQRAKELKMDTIPSLNRELAGYRKQLAKSYLTDKEVTENLVKELYERTKHDVSLQQILIKVKENASKEDVEKAQKKIEAIYAKLKKGQLTYDAAIKQYSEDKFTNRRNGKLGFMTAMFPKGFYEIENVAYSTPVGEYAAPIRSKLGYHIIKVLDKRPARGEVEVGHILLRKKKNTSADAKTIARMDSIYTVLKAGGDFNALARALSEDKSSSEKGGYIGFFGINRFEEPFENAAFGLENDGDFTKPIESSIGYHIIKRISKKPVLTYDKVKKSLKAKILGDTRYNKATQSLVDGIKKGAKFTEDRKVLEQYAKAQDESLFNYRWKDNAAAKTPLLTFGDQTSTLNDFAEYVGNTTRDRIRLENKGPEKAILALYENFVEQSALKYEEKQLEKKYPDFKSLMREYEEGILLFEVTKQNVWDKASKDTSGLKAFYEKNRNDYVWKERAEMKEFTINTTDEKQLKKVKRLMKRKDLKCLTKKFGDLITTRDVKFERGSKELAGYKFEKGAVSLAKVDLKNGVTKMYKILNIIPHKQKTLKEARGYIEADYQDELEKDWVKSLRKRYKVEVFEHVLKQLEK